MAPTVRRTQIYLYTEQYEYLRLQAEKKSTSLAQIIRELIDERLPKPGDYKHNELFLVARDGFSMGRKRGSVEHDGYIYGKKK